MFGIEIVAYLFLGGLGGGLCTIAAVAGLSIPREYLHPRPAVSYCRLLGAAFTAAAGSLILAGLMLLADAGISPALRFLFFAAVPTYLSIGAWAIVIATVLCLILALLWQTGRAGRSLRLMRIALVLAALVGFVVVLYAGLFLAEMRAVPLWNNVWLPVLFVLSSLSCGAVALVSLANLCGAFGFFSSFMRLLAKLDILLVALEAACAAAMLGVLLAHGADGPTAAAGAASALDLIAGKFAWVWWGGFVGLGLAATVVFDLLVVRVKNDMLGRTWAVLGTSFCVLAGAFALRYCIIMAGAHPVLSF